MIVDWDENPAVVKGAKVFDVDGIRYQRILICDTETGVMLCHKRVDGKVVLNQSGNPERVFLYGKPPLRVEFSDPA